MAHKDAETGKVDIVHNSRKSTPPQFSPYKPRKYKSFKLTLATGAKKYSHAKKKKNYL